MKVVLLKDLKGKGKKGDVIEISSGYAQNFLIPQGIAKAGTSTNLNEANQAKQAQEYHTEQARLFALEQKKQLEALSLKIAVKCGANGKVFGSVSNKEVSDESIALVTAIALLGATAAQESAILAEYADLLSAKLNRITTNDT